MTLDSVVAVVAVLGIAPVVLVMLWAFGKGMLVVHRDELSLHRRAVEQEDRLFEQLIEDPMQSVLSRRQAIALITAAVAMTAWPFVLTGWATARHLGAAIAAAPFLLTGAYLYGQLRRLPRRVERARAARRAPSPPV